jgi:hypothetical protein
MENNSFKVCFDGVMRDATPEEILQHEIDKERSIQNRLATSLIEKRTERNELLLKSDWVELPSAVSRLSQAKINSWLEYRQQLRDVPQQQGFPENIVWPIAPL